MEIEVVILFTMLAGIVLLGKGIALIRKDIEELKELINKKL